MRHAALGLRTAAAINRGGAWDRTYSTPDEAFTYLPVILPLILVLIDMPDDFRQMLMPPSTFVNVAAATVQLFIAR